MGSDDDAADITTFTGTCCACASEGVIRTFIQLPYRLPEQYRGEGRIAWGCVGCHLGPEGALAVVCDACFDSQRKPLAFVAGSLSSGRRASIELLVEPWKHDMAFHPEATGGS